MFAYNESTLVLRKNIVCAEEVEKNPCPNYTLKCIVLKSSFNASRQLQVDLFLAFENDRLHILSKIRNEVVSLIVILARQFEIKILTSEIF